LPKRDFEEISQDVVRDDSAQPTFMGGPTHDRSRSSTNGQYRVGTGLDHTNGRGSRNPLGGRRLTAVDGERVEGRWCAGVSSAPEADPSTRRVGPARGVPAARPLLQCARELVGSAARWVHEAAEPNWAADSRQPSDFVTHEPRVDIRPKLTRRVRRLWDGSDRAGVETERRAGVPARGQSPRS